MAETRIFGVIAGYSCAVVGFMTDQTISGNRTDVVAYYRPSGGEWTSVSGQSVNGDIENPYFAYSSWMFDLFDLEPGIEYEVYMSVKNVSSNHTTFTTETTEGYVDYEFHYRNYNENTDYEPSEGIRTSAENMMNRFNSRVASVGFINDESKLILMDEKTGARLGWKGLTSGNKIYVTSVDTATLQRNTEVLVHEFRHFLFFVDSKLTKYYGYASDSFDGKISDAANFYKFVSFPTRQSENKSEIYYYRGENSSYQNDTLYCFFALKALNGQHITIFDV